MNQQFSWRRALAIARKEMFHILRDPYTLALLLGMPILMVTVYGLAIEFNPKNIPLAVNDQDKTESSRRLIDTFASSDYFKIRTEKSVSDAQFSVTNERAKAALIIPPRFEKDLNGGRTGNIQILLDGADSATVGPVASYSNTIHQLANERIGDFKLEPPYKLKIRFLFNPELRSRWFIVPGLIVVVMSILSILLTALTVAREWENGSMELLLSTPVLPSEIIIGKLTPYGVLCLVAVAVVFFIARVFLGVPFVGNIFVLGFGLLIFLVTYLAQGLLISVVTRNQVVAMQFSMMTGYLPTQLLSGFIFPIASMPIFFQYFTMIFPARWFMEISRDSFLRGTSFWELIVPFLALLASCFFMIYQGSVKFKRDLEK
jgi:ABC-2 type transport system permease protein